MEEFTFLKVSSDKQLKYELCNAIKNIDIKKIKQLLDEGIDPTYKDNYLIKQLQISYSYIKSQRDNQQIINLLVRFNSELNRKKIELKFDEIKQDILQLIYILYKNIKVRAGLSVAYHEEIKRILKNLNT